MKELSAEELQKISKEAEAQKNALSSIKAAGDKNWTPELQKELDDLALMLVDISEALDEKMANATANGYIPEKGTEKMVHLSIVRGRRFNPMTGKEVSQPYTQLFTFAEWQVFKKNFKGLGYSILKVLHDPYGDAEELITK
ncbi:MAG: hypothetical protein J6Q67_08840 [Clostridia bacterium]|nr:hypothetical protein [Clostridia bacterium]